MFARENEGGQWVRAPLAALVFSFGSAFFGCQPADTGSLVGPNGGRVQIPLREGELVVEVPPGALDRELRISGAMLADFVPGAASVVVDLGPEGTQFKTPAKIRFRPRKADLVGLPLLQLQVATLTPKGWQFLPTRRLPGGVLEADTPHFSQFALVAPCAVSGTGVDFPLSGCLSFNPRIQTSAPVTLNVAAAMISVRLRLAASPAGGSVVMTVSGLTPSTSYFLHRDGDVNPQVLGADAQGTLSFTQSVATAHALVLSTAAGSVALSDTTCIAPLGVFNATTNTCALTQDVPDGDVSVVRPGMTLDCLDPVTQARHVIGSIAARSAVGVIAVDTANVRVKNCDVTNVDFGVYVDRSPGFEARGLTLSGTFGGSAQVGTAIEAFDSLDIAVFDSQVSGFLRGFVGFGVDRVVLRSSRLATAAGAILPLYGGCCITFEVGVASLISDAEVAELTDVEVDGVATEGLVVEGRFPAIGFESVGTVRILRLATSHLGAYGTGVEIISTSTGVADISDSSLREVGLVALRLDGVSSTISGNTFTGNGTGILLAGSQHLVFHNNLFGNAGRQVESTSPIELSDTRPSSPSFLHGNYWGRHCPSPLFVAGTDTNRADVFDAHPFGAESAWQAGSGPGCFLAAPVFTSPEDQSYLSTPRPQLSGTAAAGATIEVREAATVLGSAIVSGVGTFSFQPLAPVPDGPHLVVAIARLNGISSVPSAPVRFVVDTKPPAAPTISGPASGASFNDGPVRVSGSAEPQAAVSIRSGTVEVGRATANAEGRFEVSLALPNGQYSLLAVALDFAGNVSGPSNVVQFRVAAPSPASPLMGVTGKLAVTRVTELPDPIVVARGDRSTLTIRGKLHRSTGAQVGQSYSAELERTVYDSNGAVVRRVSSTAPIASTGALSVLAVSASWDGRFADGRPVPTGTYASVSTLQLVAGPRSGKSGVVPKDCTSASTAGPCVMDRITVFTSTAVVALGPDASYDYRTDPALSPGQRQVLAALEAQSARPLFVQTWPRAGTVYRLDLEAPSGAGSGSSLAVHARTFLAQNRGLWRLESDQQLATFDTYPAGDCSAVTFQLMQDDLPVFNATLTVVVTPAGTVRSVTGRMSGESFEVQQGTVSPSAARDVAMDALGFVSSAPEWSAPPMRLPSPAIFDPFFAFDGPHDGQLAHLFDESTGPMGPHGLSTKWATGTVVGALSGQVEFTGPVFTSAQTAVAPAQCGFSDATAWSPEVVLDPLTKTPAWVNLHHMFGVAISGADDVERAYAFLSLPQVARLWGDASPRDHLKEPIVNSIEGGSREVSFREYQAGIPVDGAYLSVQLDHRNRVVGALARFVHFPWLPRPGVPTITEGAARSVAEQHILATECGADIGCRQLLQAAFAATPASGEQVLLSPSIYEGWATSSLEVLAYRLDFAHRVVFVDASSSAVLLEWSEERSATFGYQVWSPNGSARCDDPHKEECRIKANVEGLQGFGLQLEGLAGAQPVEIVPEADLHPDTRRVAGYVEAVDQWFSSNFNYHGPQGTVGPTGFAHDLQVFVDTTDSENSYYGSKNWRTPAGVDTQIDYVLLGKYVTAQDVYAHEFMHAVTADRVLGRRGLNTGGFHGYLEPGALGESFSDIAALVSSPPSDGGWDLGSETGQAIDAGRPFRNVLEPALYSQIQHVNEKGQCVSRTSGDKCVHQWVGIPNRAAAIIATGLPGGGGRPFGRLAMADLYVNKLLIDRRMVATDRFLNQRVKAISICKELVGQTLKGFVAPTVLEDEDCDFIGQAYDEVGVLGVRSAIQPFQHGQQSQAEIITLHEGRRLISGCTINQHVLTLEILPPESNLAQQIQLSSSELSAGGQIGSTQVHYPSLRDDGYHELSVFGHYGQEGLGHDPNSTGRTYTYRVLTRWIAAPFVVFVDEQLTRPPTVPDDQACLTSPGTKEVELWSTPIVSSWSHFLDGNKFDTAVNSGESSKCEVVEVAGIHQHSDQNPAQVHAPVPSINHIDHGFVVSRPLGLGPKSLDANIHVFHDAFSSIFARVSYIVEQPIGTIETDPDYCTTPGTFRAPERSGL